MNATKVAPPIYLSSFVGYSVLVCAIVGTLANMLVLLVLSVSQRRRYSHYRYLISHLAVADLICCALLFVYVPLELKEHDWIYPRIACKFIYPSITFCTNLSIGTILTIAVERYRGVILPYSSPWRPRNILVAIGLVWLFGFLIIIPNIVKITVTKYEDKNYCNEKWSNAELQKLYGLAFFMFAFFIPLLAITVMHCHIMYRVRNRKLCPSNTCKWQQKNDVRITRVLSAMILAFLICILPNKLLYIVWDMAGHLRKTEISLYLRTIQILFYMRVAVDPLLYCFLDTRFKKDLKSTFKKLRLKKPIGDGDSRPRASTVTSQKTIARSRCSTINGVNNLSEEITNGVFPEVEQRQISWRSLPSTLDSSNQSPLVGSASPLVVALSMSNL